MRLLIPAVLISILVTGCSVPKNYAPRMIEISEPPLNKVVTSYIGDYMVRQGNFVEHDAIIIKMLIDVGAYDINPGTYLKTGEDTSGEFFHPGGRSSGWIKKAAFADGWQGIVLKKGAVPEICVVTSYGSSITTCSKNVRFSKIKEPVLGFDSFQRTLIYSGKVDNKINVGYREFSNDMARPAYSNSVEYDLDESTMIGYKGAQIEVIETTNSYIKYKVVKNFNDARL